MTPPPSNSVTHIELGLSREDQARIETLRHVQLDPVRKPSRSLAEWYEVLNDRIVNWSKVSLRDKVMFFQLLAVMIHAGMPIIRSLYVLSEPVTNPRLRNVIRELARTMENGTPLSRAMEKYDDVFSESERGMIASGEASGNLRDILKDISKQAEKSAEIVAKVRGAMIYPAAIFFIMGLCLMLMLTMVVPKLMELFNGSGKALPLATRALIACSEFAQNYWTFMGLSFVLFIWGFITFHHSKFGRYWTDWMILHLPVFGALVRQLMVARFTRLMASLIKSGVPIVKTLDIASGAIGNEIYRERIAYAMQDVTQGIPLGENLSESEFLFPPMVASMMAVGEQTANLADISNKIADYYEEEVDTAVSSLSKLMEPVILVVMGLMVGFLVAAIMQPIISLNDFAS